MEVTRAKIDELESRIDAHFNGDGSLADRLLAEAQVVLRNLTAWRPMETAPRDGTMIVAFFSGPLGGYIAICWNSQTAAWADNLSGFRRPDIQFAGWLPLVPGP